MARRDEEFAKKSFDRLLAQVGIQSPIWEDGPEPPDFLLRSGTSRYAVEVTRVVAQVDIDGNQRSKREVAAPLLRFAQEVQNAALAEGILRGAYVLSLEPIGDFKNVARAAKDLSLAYVRRTRDLPAAEKEFILKRPGSHWSIEKFHSQKTYLVATRSEGTGGLLSQILESFQGLVTTAINAKITKLARIKEPQILLLVDDYHYADDRLWQETIPAEAGNNFHTIARVFDEYQCQVLCSREATWITITT